MKFSAGKAISNTDLLFIPLYKGEKVKLKLSAKSKKQLDSHFKAKDFEGAEAQVLTVFPEKDEMKRIILLGMGEKKEQAPEAIKQLGGKIAGLVKSAKAKSISIFIEKKELEELAYGIVLGAYEFTRYKKEDAKEVKLATIKFLTDSTAELEKTFNNLQTFANASKLTRDLVNAPAGDLDPKIFEDEAKKLAKHENLKLTILDSTKLKKLGCGAIIGVGQGATESPRILILEYKHKTKSEKPDIAFVGKGITFDTGGINLKPTGHIETMKQDMAGAATVIGTMQAIAEAKIQGHFLGVLVCAENAISGEALHPGDVVKTYNRKTVEVNNTDAEGRLVLADALSYTEKNYKPKVMVNIATLTGAVSVALGYEITGIMGNDQKLIKNILGIAEAAHERIWQLPLDKSFVKHTKGNFTDLINSPDGVRAGASMGGAFLQNFVEKTRWAHFDIGGTAWADKPTSNTKYGATATCLATFIEMARKAATL